MCVSHLFICCPMAYRLSIFCIFLCFGMLDFPHFRGCLLCGFWGFGNKKDMRVLWIFPTSVDRVFLSLWAHASCTRSFQKMAEEDFEEQEMSVIPENSNPPEIQRSENDSNDDGFVNDEEKKWPGWPGENVFRMLVPVHKVGSIIGRKGEYIMKTCEETKARIKILDGPSGTTERTVLANIGNFSITKVASN